MNQHSLHHCDVLDDSSIHVNTPNLPLSRITQDLRAANDMLGAELLRLRSVFEEVRVALSYHTAFVYLQWIT
jgi:hypothetical protein